MFAIVGLVVVFGPDIPSSEQRLDCKNLTGDGDEVSNRPALSPSSPSPPSGGPLSQFPTDFTGVDSVSLSSAPRVPHIPYVREVWVGVGRSAAG